MAKNPFVGRPVRVRRTAGGDRFAGMKGILKLNPDPNPGFPHWPKYQVKLDNGAGKIGVDLHDVIFIEDEV